MDRSKLDTMTKEEKKWNYSDLQAFKSQDAKGYALIPGWMNSKYNPLGGGDVAYTKAMKGQANTQTIFNGS